MTAKRKRSKLRVDGVFACRMDVKDKGNILRAFDSYVRRNGVLDKQGRRITHVDWVNAVLRLAILGELDGKGRPVLKGLI